MRKKYLFYALLASSMLAAGCGKTTSQSATETTVSQDEVQSETVEGRISSISDSEITIETRQMENPPEKPDGQESGEPDDKNGDKPDDHNSEKPDDKNGGKPDDKNGDKPDDKNGKPENTSDDSASSTTLSITSTTAVLKADGSEGSLSDLTEGTFVSVTSNDSNEAITITISDQKGGPDNMGGGPGGGSSAPTSYDAVTDITEDTTESGKSYSSTGTDENAIHISNGASVNLSDFTVDRTSSESNGGDQSSFYGIGAGILVTDGTAELKNGTITTDAKGGAGVFSYGDGVVNISDTTIKTTKDTSGGIHVAGGGTLNAKNLTIETAGESSAAIRSDRGGGTMTVDGGSYTSTGTGSPAVYCTADIDIKNAKLTAKGSEAVCIEGLNSLKLTDCDLAGDMPENEQNDCIWTIILYQSMSGDSEVGNSTFDMEGGTLTSSAGGLFYTTNTESTFYLKNVKITPSESNDFFLKCTGNSNKRGWGKTGSNGADCEFTADTQIMEGDVIWDSISNLDFTMSNGSSLKGAFIQDESSAGDGGSGYANLTIGSGCAWTVTADSRVTSLNNSGTIIGSDGKSVSIVGSDGTSFVKGDSAYTITVDTYTAN